MAEVQEKNNVPNTAYAHMLADGKFNDRNPGIKAAGKSLSVMDVDTSARDIMPDIYFPAPPTPTDIRKYRKNCVAGEIVTHFGLKDQHLPDAEFRYGEKTNDGDTVAKAFEKAAECAEGIAAYKNARKESVYLSNTREPLGVSYIRGHVMPEFTKTDAFRGFGKCSEDPEDAKYVIFPRGLEPVTTEIQDQYVYTHGNYAPGQMHVRNYNWPEETKKDSFRFGITDRDEIVREGDGVKYALTMENDLEEETEIMKTQLRTKASEDYRSKYHDKLGKSRSMVYDYPPVPSDFKFGLGSKGNVYSVADCVGGGYTKEEQMPDEDLGRCMVPGRRNITDGKRTYGTPSVRDDIPGPAPGKRGLADTQNYGDEAGTGPLLNPTRFESMAISKDTFSQARKKEELRDILKCSKLKYDDAHYDALWLGAVQWQHGDNPPAPGQETASVDAFLAVTKEYIHHEVRKQLDAVV